VKTRSGTAFGPPFEAVTWKKQRKLRLLADAFLHGSAALRLQAADFRFDVASVTIDRSGRVSLHVFESAF
jgi:putative endonuclease